jgi:predicted aspartyl protease
MGTFRVNCRIENIVRRQKSIEVQNLLVDTGSDYSWLPAKALEQIGVKREKKDIVLVMANGQEITRSVGFAIIRTGSFFTVDEVIFADPGDLSLLGARTLEGFNARVDSKQKKLVAAGPLVAAESEKGKRKSKTRKES